MEQIKQYRASDGKIFDSREACEEHEDDMLFTCLSDRKLEEIHAALAGRDKPFADALEAIGNRIAEARRERGELRRVKKAKAE